MRLFLYIGVVIYIYLSTSVAAKIGIEQAGTTSSFIIVLLTLLVLVARDLNKTVARFKAEFAIILLALIIIVLKVIMQDPETIRGAIFFLIVPAFLSILLGVQGLSVRQELSKIVLIFFITECFLAIYERVTLLNIFPYEELSPYITIEALFFRSTAFLGHPLANALCVSIIMGFVLTTTMRGLHKIIFIIMGYIALLSFNARAALLVWTFLILIYLISMLFSERIKNLTKLTMIMFFLLSIYGIYVLIVKQGFGDRLFMAEVLMDGSAMTRLSVFDAFSYMQTTDFLFGSSANLTKLLTTASVGGYENSYIVIITNYGIVMSLLLFIIFFFWIKQLLKPYTIFNKMIIITSFILVGSTNNGLVTPTPWAFFTICAISFRFINQSKIGHTNSEINTKNKIQSNRRI